jgi:hypothetical protein
MWILNRQAGKLLVWLVLSVFLITPGLAYADEGSGGQEAEVNGYHVRLVFAAPVQVGVNALHVQLVRADGSAVREAQVEIIVRPVEGPEESDAHNAGEATKPPPTGEMSGMDAPEPTPTTTHIDDTGSQDTASQTSAGGELRSVLLSEGHDAGEYAGEINFPQAGHWRAVVHFKVQGESLEAEFPLEVGQSMLPAYNILAGFFGLNVVILGVAAVTRRKTQST